jgi:hypothetical protein
MDEVKDSKSEYNDDDLLKREIFDYRFYYKKNDNESDLVKQVVNVKVLSCKIVLLCFESFISSTIFKPVCEDCQSSKVADSVRENVKDEIVKNQLNVSKVFRTRVWREKEMRLKANGTIF